MPGSILGTEVRRVEDPELLRGRGTFVDNLRQRRRRPRGLRAQPFAHARITGIDTDRGARRAGRAGRLHRRRPRPRARCRASPRSTQLAPRPPLAVDKVRFVGDPVALVVAETRAQAGGRRRAGRRRLRRAARRRRHGGRARPTARPCSSRRSARNIATQPGRQGHRRRRARRRRPRRPGPDGEPAHRGRPDGGQRDPGPARPATGMDGLGLDPAAPHGHATCSPGASASTPSTCASSRPTSAAPSAARPASGPTTPRSRRGPPARPAGEVGRDPQRGDALDARPRPGAVRRARARPTTAGSPACGCG